MLKTLKTLTNNCIFIAYKPCFISSNRFMQNIKKKYNLKKVGFSGILDYFACGNLVMASGKYTRLFNYINKSVKTYRGVIWLGAQSDSCDIENINVIANHKKLNIDDIKIQLDLLVGKITYMPNKYSAKKINGKKAYELARKGEEVYLKDIVSNIYDIKFLNYSHPFINFKISVSEGSYIRNIVQILLKNLHSYGTLSYLERLKEGEFYGEYEKSLNIFNHLSIKENTYNGEIDNLIYGKKLCIDDFVNKKDGIFYTCYDKYFCIISIDNNKVSYKINNIEF